MSSPIDYHERVSIIPQRRVHGAHAFSQSTAGAHDMVVTRASMPGPGPNSAAWRDHRLQVALQDLEVAR